MIDGVGGHAKTMMKKDEINGLCIPAVGFEEYLPSLSERLTKNMTDEEGITHCFFHQPTNEDLRILKVHDTLFKNMGKLSKKTKEGQKINTGMRAVRMVKSRLEERRSKNYIKFNLSNSICPDLCCLFSDDDFCEKSISYTITGNSAEFHPFEK